MGLEVDRDTFEEEDYARFSSRLCESLDALERVLARPGFGEGPASLGAELELCLVDAAGRPLPKNRAVLADAVDPRVTLEIDRFNLELNTRPTPLAARPFTALASELEEALALTARAAAAHGGRVVTIGILPTLEEADLAPAALTEFHRYRALSAGLRRLRRGPFPLRIAGEDELSMTADDVTFEGANTSLQVHLRVAPAAFADTYNAAQIATAPALAAACNSPLFLGRRLWAETRVALFRQSVDDRSGASGDDWRPARVSFGHGWVRRGAHELFAESVALHEPLLPVLGDEDPLAVERAGGLPSLSELRLHHGTVWRWNRAVYDRAYGGHLRIELRALPSGPTVADMTANAAFVVGLTLALAPDANRLLHSLTFGHARRNFYEAARHGLDAELLWPSSPGLAVRPRRARDVAIELLEVAARGLALGGVDPAEAARWLGIVEQRLRLGRTGAGWQRAAFDALARRTPGRSALAAMLERYMIESASGRPLHEWTPLADE